VGGLLGGITVSALGIRARRKTLVMAVCMSTLGLGQVVCGLSTTVVGLAAGMFLGELLLAPLNAASYTLWQGLTPPHLLARALATRRFISQSAFPVGTALAGWLAAGVEPWLVVTVSGALLVLYSAALIASPGFRGIEGRMREAAARPD
jgi:MFS family permease